MTLWMLILSAFVIVLIWHMIKISMSINNVLEVIYYHNKRLMDLESAYLHVRGDTGKPKNQPMPDESLKTETTTRGRRFINQLG